MKWEQKQCWTWIESDYIPTSTTYILPHTKACVVGIIAFDTHEQSSVDSQTKESVHIEL